MSICFQVLKHQSGLTRDGREVNGIFHQEDDVNVVRLGFGRNKRSKDDEPCLLPRGYGEMIDSVQPLSHGTTLHRALTETFKDGLHG